MEKEQKITLARIIASAALLVVSFIPSVTGIADIIICIAAYLIIGGDVIIEAFGNIFHGELFDENLLMVIATIGAIAIGDYPEAAAVMLFFSDR